MINLPFWEGREHGSFSTTVRKATIMEVTIVLGLKEGWQERHGVKGEGHAVVEIKEY